MKWPTMLRELVVPCGLSFSGAGAGSSGETVCLVLHFPEGGAKPVSSCFSYPSNKSVVVSVVYWLLWLQPHHVLGFSQWCPGHEKLLIVLLVRPSKVRNSLCHHLGDITSPTCLSMSLYSLTSSYFSISSNHPPTYYECVS